MNCQDIDKIDFDARHYFFEKEGNVFAYLRAFYTDSNTVRIGRVLTVKHGNGWGRKIMELAIDDIKVNMPCKTICLDSQKHAVEFYEKVGFKVVSDEFIEEGVPHVKMELEK
jgi:ElaA protein